MWSAADDMSTPTMEEGIRSEDASKVFSCLARFDSVGLSHTCVIGLCASCLDLLSLLSSAWIGFVFGVREWCLIIICVDFLRVGSLEGVSHCCCASALEGIACL